MEKSKLSIKLLELRKQILDSEGFKLFEKKKNLEGTIYIFKKNYEELIESIHMYYSDKLDEWITAKSKNHNDFFLEFQRYLHNFLSSVFSLIEHATVFKKKLKNKEFTDFYELTLRSCLSNKCVIFIKELRVYCQHYKLPFSRFGGSTHLISLEGKIISVSKHNKKMFIGRLVFLKSELLQWDGWTKDAKDYMSNYQLILDSKPVSKDIIDIKDVLDNYYELISNFYNVILKKFNELYFFQLSHFFNLNAEMEKILILNKNDL